MRHRHLLLLAIASLPLIAAAEPLGTAIGDRAATEVRRTMPGETADDARYGEEYIEKFEVVGKTTALDAAQSSAITTALRDPALFPLAGNASCTFRPGIAYRVGTGTNVADVLVCFACDEVSLVPLGGTRGPLYTMTQPARDVLLNTAKAVLPTDEAIQELPAVRREGTIKAKPVPTPILPAATPTES